MSISRSIVQAVRSLDPPGRFLDKDQVTGLWHDIGHKKAVEKTSQALRDGAAMLRKQLSADLGNPNFLNAVFDDNVSKSSEVGKDKKGREKPSIKTNGKENSNNKDTKGNSSEKIKVAKVCFIDACRLWSQSYIRDLNLTSSDFVFLVKGKKCAGEERAPKSFCFVCSDKQEQA